LALKRLVGQQATARAFTMANDPDVAAKPMTEEVRVAERNLDRLVPVFSPPPPPIPVLTLAGTTPEEPPQKEQVFRFSMGFTRDGGEEPLLRLDTTLARMNPVYEPTGAVERKPLKPEARIARLLASSSEGESLLHQRPSWTTDDRLFFD